MTDGGMTRARLLDSAVLAGGGALVAGALLWWRPSQAASRSAEQDAEILNFVLLMEHVQAGFYADALAGGRLQGELREYAEKVGAHEREHVEFIRGALGSAARDEPKLDFGDVTRDPRRFTDAAIELERLGLAAYHAQAPNLTGDALRSAARIVSVESRHAAWILDIAGRNPAPDSAEPRLPADQVVQRLNGLGYVK